MHDVSEMKTNNLEEDLEAIRLTEMVIQISLTQGPS